MQGTYMQEANKNKNYRKIIWKMKNIRCIFFNFIFIIQLWIKIHNLTKLENDYTIIFYYLI